MNKEEVVMESVQGFKQVAVVSEQPGFIRYTVVVFVVGLYIILGFLLHLDVNTYLLLGIPFTVLFQLFIAHHPLRELWLLHGQPLRFDVWTMAWLILFLIGPVLTIREGIQAGDWPVMVYGTAALVGALGAALAFRVLGGKNLRQLGLVLIVMALIGLVRLLLQRSTAGATAQDLEAGTLLRVGLESLLFYVPAVFVVEEVFFRGALDSYLQRGEHGIGWASAAFVSVIWGLWHMPIVGPLSIAVILQLIGTQLVIGLILSWLWRRTGNLAMPGAMHAALDTVRNVLLL